MHRHDLSQPERIPGVARAAGKPCVSENLWVACDRCQVAEAQVEVVTDAGSVFCASTTTSSIATRSLRLVT
jgi:hypothetical protein